MREVRGLPDWGRRASLQDAGLPSGEGMRCDGCGDPLSVDQLVVAVGIWVEDRGIYNIAGWFTDYIREPSAEELRAYREVELAATVIKEVQVPICSGCGNAVDRGVCGCGSDEKSHSNPMNDGHHFIPMGCDCFRSKGAQ